jgi:acetyl esterase/lipase
VPVLARAHIFPLSPNCRRLASLSQLDNWGDCVDTSRKRKIKTKFTIAQATRIVAIAALSTTFLISLLVAANRAPDQESSPAQIATTTPATTADKNFYSAADLNLSSYPNGALIRSAPMENAPDNASAFRVLYRSTGLHGEPIAVSGVVIVPAGTPPPGGRPIVAWAHPTTGIVAQCAPSLARVFFRSIQGLHELLAQGFVIAATDYPGLGTAGPHPYLVGISEARAVLDSVRVARQIPGSGNGKVFAVWGHSQGGQAALFTGILAHEYAPELELVGVAAAAPATDLATLLSADLDTNGGRNITAMTLWSWSRIYNAPIDNVVTPEAIPVIDRLANDCIERFFDVFTRRAPSRALTRSFLKVKNVSDIEPWHTLLVENSPGPLPSNIPVFLAQGTKDQLVLPAVTQSYYTKLCQSGSPVQFDSLPNVGHLFAARDSAKPTIAWLSVRFRHEPAPTTCPK